MAPKLKLIEGDRLNPTSIIVEGQSIVQTLTKEVRHAHFVEKVTISKLAKGMKVCPSTVSRMLHGESRYPRFATILMALNYFGYTIYAKRG